MTNRRAQIRARLERATAGPWQVIETRYDDDGSGKGLCGKVAERRIFTAWDHPQMKGPIGVVNTFVTIHPIGGQKPYRGVSLNTEDADFLVNAPEDIAYLLAERDALQAAASERDAIATLLSDRSEPGTYAKVEALLAELDAGEARRWQPIETLDVDRVVLLFAPKEVLWCPETIAADPDNAVDEYRVSSFRHWGWAKYWMPLPLPPVAAVPGSQPSGS